MMWFTVWFTEKGFGNKGDSREEETWPEPEFILKVETTEFAGRSDVGYDRKEGLGWHHGVRPEPKEGLNQPEDYEAVGR